MGPVQKRNTRKIIALSLLACLTLSVGFVFAPMKSVAAARQAIAARLSASPTAQRIISVTPSPVRRLVSRQFEPVTIISQANASPVATLSASEANLGASLEASEAMILDTFTNTVLTAQPVCAGTNVQYQLAADNDGGAETNVAITFTAPAGWNIAAIVQANFTGLTCVGIGTPTLSCSGGSLGANLVGTVTVTVAIPPATAPGMNAPGNAGSYSSDQVVTLGATGTGVVTTQSCLNLTLTKTRAGVSNTGGAGNLVAGSGAFDDINYTISINNTGPSTALPGQVNITDLITSVPDISALLAIDAAVGGSFSPGCTTATLFTTGCTNTVNITPTGGTSTRTLTYDVEVGADVPTQCTTINNSATASIVGMGVTNTGVTLTGSAAQVQVVSRANFDFDNESATPTVYAGQEITYGIQLEHDEVLLALDSSTIFGGVMRFNFPTAPVISALPPIAEFVSATPPAGWVCTPDAVMSPTFVDCVPPVTGIPGIPFGGATQDFNFSFVVRTNSLLPNGTILTTTAATWTPPPSGACDSGAQSNSPTSALVSTTIIANADLGIVKVANPAAVTAGDPASILTYTLTFGNNPGVEPGSDAVNVEIHDIVPANVTVVTQPVWVQLTPPEQYPMAAFNVVCTPAVTGLLFTCTPMGNEAINPSYVTGVLPRGVTGTITYQVTVPANINQNTIIGNQASINSNQAGQVQPTPDPNSGNNVSLTTSTIVNAVTDLGITKVTSNATPTAGGAAFSYTLVVSNNGPSDAQNIVVNDPLPAGIIFQNVSVVNAPSIPGYGLICSGPPVGTNGTVTCTGNLPAPTPGMPPTPSTSTITIVAQVVANVASGVRTNTATVASDTQEANPNVFLNTASVQQNIEVVAPLSITKTGPATVNAGDIFTYHLTVLNGGSSTALNATISDPLPANTTFLNLSGTGAFTAGCSHNGGTPGTVTCAAVDIPSGLSTLDITVRLSPNAPMGILANTATITTAGTGTIAVGDSTFNTQVNHAIDVEVTKTASPNPVAPGQIISFTITVKNNGPSDAASQEISIDEATFPPTGTTLVGTINAPAFNCNAGVAFPCQTNSPLAVGASTTIQYQVRVNPDVTASQVCNSAFSNTVVSTEGTITDPVAANNSSSACAQIVPAADLGVVKTALTVAGGVFGASVTAGGGVLPGFGIGNVGLGEIEYTLAYSNAGPSDASNVHIRDVIPAGTLLDPTFLPIGVVVTPTAGPGLTCQILPTLNEYQLDCTPNTAGGVLPNGAAGTIQFAVRVPENILEGHVVKNQATINSEPSAPVNGDLAAALSTADPNAGNNTSLETQNIVRTSADLLITKVAPDDVQAGNTINYVLQVTNLGVSDAQDVVVKDTLPAGVSFVSATSPNGSVSCSHDGGVVTCTLATLIAPAINPPPIIPPRVGSNIFDITIVGQVDPALAAGTALSNTATVSASTQDPVPANNTASDGTTVTTQAVVTIVKSDSPDPVVAGTNLTYTISVNNAGPSNALNLVVTDTLPADTSFVSISGTGVFANAGVCTHNGAVPGAITCNGGSFAPGTETITVVVKVDSDYPSGTISNTAVVAWQDTNGAVGAQVDQTAQDDETTAVIRQADLELDKSSDSGPWIAGTTIDFTIKLTNNGPSDVFGGTTPGSIVVTDTLPTGSSLANIPNNVVVAGPGGFTCTQTNGTVTCLNAAGAPGNFPAGAMTTIILKLTIPSSTPAGGNFCNTATVAIDPDVIIAVDVDPDLDAVDPNSGNNTDTACVVVTTSADLGLAKTAIPVVDPDGAGPLAPVALPLAPAGAVNAGGYIRYDVPFANAGPSDSINVTLTDAPPGNTAFVGALAVGGVFVPAAQPPAVPFNFTIGALDATNQAIVLACTVLGAPGSQQLRCSPADNTAVDPAYGVGVLPAGASGTLTFFVQVNASVSGGTVVHNSANITSGPGAGEQAGSTPDPNASNNTSLPIPTLVVANSSLTVSKIVQSAVTAASNPNQTGPIGPATAPNGAGLTGTAVIPGTVLTYRITVTNNGPSDVHDVQLTDILPSGLETPPGRVLGVRYVSVNPVLPSPLTWVCAPPTGINPANNPQSNGGSLQCTGQGGLSAVAPNNTTAIDVVVFIDAATKANLVNTATVNATTNGFNQPVSGTAVLTTPVAATSDLALTKTHTTPVVAGLEFDYTVTLTNNGPSAAQMVSLVDTLPPFQTVTNISIAQSPNGNGAPNFSCATVLPTITCTAAELPPNKNADGTVNPAGTVVFTIRVLQDPLTPQPTPVNYQNCVSATSMSTDPTPVNNTNICDTVTVTFSADSQAQTLKTDTPDPVIAGELLTYNITARNPGPSAALNLTINDPLPAGTVFISAVASPGATLTTPAVGTNGTVTAVWDAAGGTPGGLTAPGVDRTLTIVVRVCPDVVCNTILTNTATATSGTPDPNIPNNPGVATTTVQTRAELSISKSVNPAVVKPTQNVTYTLNFANAGPSNSASTVITDVLPAGFQVVSVVSTTPGMTFSQAVGGPTGDQVTLTINLGVLGAANQCATSFPLSGTVTIVALVPSKFPNVFVTNTASIASGNCLAELNQADNTSSVTHEVATEPLFQTVGQPFPANSEASDDKAGSVLFFPLYTSNASLPGSQNTRISMTNVSQTEMSVVHLFVVDGTTCSAQDVYICLTPNQTITFRSSDFDPNITGYIVAVAVNPVTGIPMACNFLIGDAYVKFSSGHALNYGAVAVSALQLNPAGVDQTATQATLKFDGINYNRLPRQVAVDGIPSPGDGNSTMIALHAVGGNMSQSGATLGSLTGNLFDDRENNYSFNSTAPNCQFRSILTDQFPRTFVPFSAAITPGHSGWMKIRAFNDVAILGVQLNFNPNAAVSGTAFNQGHVLHTMTLTNSATLVVPVDFPGC